MIFRFKDQHYRILRLDPEVDVLQSGIGSLSVDLTRAYCADPLTRDRQVFASYGAKSIRYISGGGSYLFDNEWLLVVRRDMRTLINPGKLSLFTGRANGLAEWLQPRLVFRELLEEVSIYDSDRRRLIPVTQETAYSIAPVVDDMRERDGRRLRLVEADDLEMRTTRLEVRWKSTRHEDTLAMTTSRDGDLFVLSVVKIPEAPWQYWFEEHESRTSKRDILALNIRTHAVIPVSRSRTLTGGTFTSQETVSTALMTDHLVWVLSQLNGE